ncbi:hypothetical protein RYZ59_06690 [Citrobacter sp. HN-141]|nr:MULTISPECIES: hypothetical protein [unclassified Citrobacter]MDW2643274.1 hypothetical protein [Citrobacter sp. HN-141]MDW2652621.1 hypothetical protein [Citrobacter sp. HN-120]MDW2695646.1 hypothetical protein [Citrobacter sp. HN-144]
MSALIQADIYPYLPLPPAFPGAFDALTALTLFSRGGVEQYIALSTKN